MISLATEIPTIPEPSTHIQQAEPMAGRITPHILPFRAPRANLAQSHCVRLYTVSSYFLHPCVSADRHSRQSQPPPPDPVHSSDLVTVPQEQHPISHLDGPPEHRPSSPELGLHGMCTIFNCMAATA